MLMCQWLKAEARRGDAERTKKTLKWVSSIPFLVLSSLYHPFYQFIRPIRCYAYIYPNKPKRIWYTKRNDEQERKISWKIYMVYPRYVVWELVLNATHTMRRRSFESLYSSCTMCIGYELHVHTVNAPIQARCWAEYMSVYVCPLMPNKTVYTKHAIRFSYWISLSNVYFIYIKTAAGIITGGRELVWETECSHE